MIRRDGLKIIKWNIFQNYFSLLTRNHWQSQRWEDWQETEEFSWRLWSPHSLSPAPSLVQRDPWSYTRDEDDDDVVIYLCSHSQTPCHVPSVTLPSQIGSVKLDPSRHAWIMNVVTIDFINKIIIFICLIFYLCMSRHVIWSLARMLPGNILRHQPNKNHHQHHHHHHHLPVEHHLHVVPHIRIPVLVDGETGAGV